LSVSCLSADALYHIAVLPKLEELALTDTYDILPPRFSQSSTVRFFPSLKELHVSCDVAFFAIRLVEALSSSPLTSIDIIPHLYDESGYQGLIDALREYCPRSSLKSIYIAQEYDEESITTSVDVKPLFIFSGLTRISLFSEAPFELDNTSLKDMAQAWLHIVTLTLKSPSSHVTLCGLVPLAQYCSKL